MSTETPISKDNPDKRTGYWCGNCGHAMRYNVPRMGPDGGYYVHADTSRLQCGSPEEIEAFNLAAAKLFQNPTPNTEYRIKP